MAGHDIVVIGGSAGGVEAIRQLCRGLPADLPAAVFVVLHLNPHSRSVLPEMLSRTGSLPAQHPRDGEPIVPGRIYVAPPDQHMLLLADRIILRRGPRENRTRPAIDPLFRSAAVNFRARVIGVVLSGMLDDGAAGLTAIKLCGGICVAQAPEDALWSEMPRNALLLDHVDHTATIAEMPVLLARLVAQPQGPPPAEVPANLIEEATISSREPSATMPPQRFGHPSRFTCPECGGVLQETDAEGSTQFRCQIGHAFTAEGLRAAQDEELERALESAMRLHRERVTLFRRMQQESESKALPHAAAHWRTGADESERAAELITQAIGRLRAQRGG